MARPKKFPAARRDDQIVVYVHKVVGDALRNEAQLTGVSVSTLVADILQEWVSSGGATIVVPDETVYAVMKKLAVEGLLSEKIIDAKFAPKSNQPQDDDSTSSSYQQPPVDNLVDNVGDKSGANSAPKTSDAAPEAAQEVKQRRRVGLQNRRGRVVNRGKPRGGDRDVT